MITKEQTEEPAVLPALRSGVGTRHPWFPKSCASRAQYIEVGSGAFRNYLDWEDLLTAALPIIAAHSQ
jgi:hypothetical protein